MLCEVISKYFNNLDSYLNDEKSPRDYGSGQLLYQSEINFINAIYNNPESNAMELSKKLNITRGAVTQYGNKLEEKGIVTRYLKEGNKKEKYYKLTDLGYKVVSGYIQYHKNANKEICNYLSSLTPEEISIITEFLDRISDLPVTKCNFDSGKCYFDNELLKEVI